MSASEVWKNTYRQEAEDLLANIEMKLLDSEESAMDKETLQSIFRSMHTIKGSGAMVGFLDIADFTHNIETVLDRVCKGVIPFTRELVDLILSSLDHIRNMLSRKEGEAVSDSEAVDRISAAFERMISSPVSPTPAIQSDALSAPAYGDTLLTYRIKYRPHAHIFASGMNPLFQFDDLRELGTCMVQGHAEKVPVLHDMDPEKCYLYWDCVIETNQPMDAVKDVFKFVEADADISVHQESADEAEEESMLRLCQHLLENGYITAIEFTKAIGGEAQIAKLIEDMGVISGEEIESGIDPEKILEKKTVINTETIRVPLDKLNYLVNLAGELTIMHERLSQEIAALRNKKLTKCLKPVGRLTREMRNCILDIRMIPIGPTFGRFRRYVRDMTKELGKEIEFEIRGADTELDKTIIEQLVDPLVHLIRNSVDHGLEMPEARQKKGKPAKGKITLAAVQRGSNIVITIEDDGAGINPEFVRKKAVERGLISQNAEVSEKEAYALLFAPGFSTAKTLSNISGRGVGMDIVKRAVDSLRGSIQINSVMGQGTVISISLPLTLAIVDGLLMKVDRSLFIVSLDSVEEILEFKDDRIRKSVRRDLCLVRHDLVPFVRLREILRLSDGKPDFEKVVIVRTDTVYIGIVVDDVIGEHQTVFKSMGKLYHDVDWLSGGTITGYGEVAFILDVPGLVRFAKREEALTCLSDN